MKAQPIGVIDSGVGGLTVLKEIMQKLPKESLIYVGDSKHAPYGSLHADEIYKLATRLVTFLLEQNTKLIVVACNTITVSCIDRLRTDYPDIPIVGAVPVVKTAVKMTKNKRIGIISTTRTAQSDYQKKLIEKFTAGYTVFNHGTDTLVPLIEQGKLSSSEMETALHRSLSKFISEDIDTLALGCTHFPFIKTEIQKILGDDVQILDSGAAIARQVKRILEHNKLLTDNANALHLFYTTGNPVLMEQMISFYIKRNEEVKVITL